MRPLIKVCGMRDAANIRAVESLGIEWMGFIFWPKSSRFVSQPPAYLPANCKRVGVFVDADIEQVLRTANDYALHLVQLHGSESPAYVLALRQRLTNNGSSVAIIKAFNIATAADFLHTTHYAGLANYFLFDTKTDLPGGSGRQFNWLLLSHYSGETPYMLSGGIGPADAPYLRQAFAHHDFPATKCIGIDLNSRFELAPALKDTEALQHFIQNFEP